MIRSGDGIDNVFDIAHFSRLVTMIVMISKFLSFPIIAANCWLVVCLAFLPNVAQAEESTFEQRPVDAQNANLTRYLVWDPQKGEITERTTGPQDGEASVKLSLYTLIYPQSREAEVAGQLRACQELIAETGHTLTARTVRLNIRADLDVIISVVSQTGKINLVADPTALKKCTQDVAIDMNGPAADILFAICLLWELTPEFQKPALGMPGQLFLRERDPKVEKRSSGE